MHEYSNSVCLVYLTCFLFHLQVKQESLAIPTKMFLKVDVESGRLYLKKSKDGPEDKYFVHNKSKTSVFSPSKQCGSSDD